MPFDKCSPNSRMYGNHFVIKIAQP
ncbi:MAG: hypothetical protein JWQ66_3755, partial [Mucilaginibacter sp.]|nr:hypothetical protein [Mucilaginibacter sp.]